MPEPFEIDKLPASLQWAAILGTALAGFVTWLLSRRVPPKLDSSAHDGELEQLKLRRDLEQTIHAQRESFFEQLRRERRDWEHEIGELENRIRQLEIGAARQGRWNLGERD